MKRIIFKYGYIKSKKMTLRDFYKGKMILVTGGVGSVGSHLVKTLLKFDPRTVRILDVSEAGLTN